MLKTPSGFNIRAGVVRFQDFDYGFGGNYYLVHYTIDHLNHLQITAVYTKDGLLDLHRYYLWHKKLQFVRRFNRTWL